MTINTDADVIRVIQENPRLLLRALTDNAELLAEVRRVVLTDELLAMPGQLAEVVKTQNEMLKTQNEMQKTLNGVLKTQNEMQKTLNGVLKTQDEMQKTLNGVLKTQDEMQKTLNEVLKEQANVRRDIGALHRMFRQQHDDFSNFRGNFAISAARRNDADIALLFSKAHGFNRLDMRDFTRRDLSDFLTRHYAKVDALHLRERAWRTFPRGDIIARVTERMGDSPGFYLAVEASYTGDLEDVQRATDHAKILRCAGDLDAYAVVAGVRMNDAIEGSLYEDVESFISARDENAAFWFPLDPKKLDPDELY